MKQNAHREEIEYAYDQPGLKKLSRKQMQTDGLYVFGWRNDKAMKTGYPAHYHPGRFEFHYVKTGARDFWVEEEKYTVVRGQIFVNFPNEVHSIYADPLFHHEMYWFQLQQQEQVLGLDKSHSQQLLERLARIGHRVIPVDTSMPAMIEEAFSLIQSADPFDRQCAAALMSGVLHRLIRQDDEVEQTAVSPVILSAAAFIQTHAAQALSMEKVAEQAGFSLSHFKARFKKEMGLTPTQYYMGLRIEQAKELLTAGRSVTDTAIALEFSSPSYFATVFRRITNMTPTQYILWATGRNGE